MTQVLARLRGVVRRFGAVTALSGADLEVRAREVHGVLGENGAGKTTLLGVLGGMVQPNAGSLEISGRAVRLSGPRAAWEHGVGLVHQHFTLVPTLSVLENLALGRNPGTSGLRLPLARVRTTAERLSDRTGLEVPLDAIVEDVGVGDRQRVEIFKALLREPRILVLDEPTAVLTPAEVESLFGLLRDLAGQGRGVVLVTHKIDEALAVADRITVLRRGRAVSTARRGEVDGPALVEAMVGREVDSGVRAGSVDVAIGRGPASRPETGRGVASGAAHRAEGPPVARLEKVSVRSRSGSEALRGVSLTMARGEIVGIAGVEGNGQRELALVLAGRLAADTGMVSVPPGVGFIPQDRTLEGLIPDFDLVENVALALHDDPAYGRGAWLGWRKIREEAESLVSRFDVVASGVDARAGTLSGGNQQRLVVGRELLRARDLLVAENPTRGLDVAAAAYVHGQIERLAEDPSGPAVVLISTDLDEVLALSGRILVMASGKLLAVSEGDRTREAIGSLMLREVADA